MSDSDTFADWDEIAAPTAVTDVPGLIAPSITAAALAPGTSSLFELAQNLTSPPLINFTVDLDFAVPKFGRDLYLFLEAAGSGPSRANIGYNSAVNSFIAFQGTAGGSGVFNNVLPITLTANTPYKLRITKRRNLARGRRGRAGRLGIARKRNLYLLRGRQVRSCRCRDRRFDRGCQFRHGHQACRRSLGLGPGA